MDLSKMLVTLGAIMLAIGLMLKFAPWLLSWFGKLPGDIRVESEHSYVFIPITSMIITSVLATLLINVLFRK